MNWHPVILPAVTFASAIGLTIALAVKTAMQRRPKETPDVYGDARFMNEKELKSSGLLVGKHSAAADGVYIGAWQDGRGRVKYLRDVSNAHVLMCGPTRSGKGVSCILPTLLSWRGSAIIHDEKGELWEQTARWREKHIGPVIRWEPGAYSDSASWNPLSEVRLTSAHEIADAQNVALMLIDVRGHGTDRLDHWQKASIPLLAGCVLHELYLARTQGRIGSLPDIAGWFSDPTSSADALWEEMRDNAHLGGLPHPVIAAAGRSQTDRSDRERSSVTSTLLTHLTVFHDHIVAANTTDTDFQLVNIADDERPMTIYVTALPNDTVRLRPLLRLFVTSALRSLMGPKLGYVDGQAVSPHRYRTLMLLDEFASFGKLEEVETDLARAAGWGVKFLVCIQDLAQLNGIYGPGHSIVANTHTRVFFSTSDLVTAKLLSESTGMTTAQTPHTTIMGRRIGFMGQVTKSIQPTQRPLMTPGEIMTMKAAEKDEDGHIIEPGDMLILMTGHRPMKAQQLLYFRDPEFWARSQTAPAQPAQLLLPAWQPALPAE